MVSGAFSSVSRARFRLPRSVVPVHILIVLGLLLGSLLASAVLRAVWKTGKWITVLPVGVLAVVLCEFYILSAIGWMMWIDAISIPLLVSYLPQLFRAPGADVQLSFYLLFVPSAAALLTLLSVLYRGMPALFREISWAADPEGLAIFGRRRFALHAIESLILYSCLFAFLFWAALHSRRSRGEPVISLFSPIRPTSEELPRSFYDRSRRTPGEDAPYSVSRDPQRKNVVVIVVDALRADHLTGSGYPRDTTPLLSRRLENTPVLAPAWTTSACSISECGILAVLTSRPFQRLNAGLFSLPEALHRAGYRTYFAMSGDFTKVYRGLRDAVGNHADLFADGLSDSRYAAYDDRVILRTLERIPNRSDTPAFFYFHLHSAHEIGEKYQPPTWTPSGFNPWKVVRSGKDDRLSVLAKFGFSRELLTNTYDNGVRQADAVMEQILSALNQKGYLERSVVVITADHGEPLGEHDSWRHGNNLYAESINIPLFFFDTDFHASRRVPYATHLDVAPTIADLAGIPIPVQWEGRSLLRPVPEISTAETTRLQPLEAVIWRTAGANYKYLFNTPDGTEQLFELRRDPAEQVNLIPIADPALMAFLRETRVRKFGAPVGPALRTR
jgi:arylsulfatase A-like enzyme